MNLEPTTKDFMSVNKSQLSVSCSIELKIIFPMNANTGCESNLHAVKFVKLASCIRQLGHFSV